MTWVFSITATEIPSARFLLGTPWVCLECAARGLGRGEDHGAATVLFAELFVEASDYVLLEFIGGSDSGKVYKARHWHCGG
jgi:hypothetical protein